MRSPETGTDLEAGSPGDADNRADAVLLARYGRRRATELLGRPPVSAGRPVPVGVAARPAGTGPRPRRYRPAAALAAVLGVAGILGWVTWASAGQNPGSVSSQLIGFDTTRPQSVAVVFAASGPVGSALSCVVDATDRNGTVVGRAVIRVPAAATTSRQVRARVATVARAVDVTLDGCQAPGQAGLH